jgi:site-specific recombinase XerC
LDWLVTGQIVPHNPAAPVPGLGDSTKKGRRRCSTLPEARQLLDAIDVTTPAGLRDRALTTLMVFSFARVGSLLAMRVEDIYVSSGGCGCACVKRGQAPRDVVSSHA